MKTTLLKLAILALIAAAGCTKYDNYAAPEAGIFGNIIDAETGQPIETKQPGGGSIRLLQWDLQKYPSPQPVDISIKADGTYSSTRFFADDYKAFPWNGPFRYLDDSVNVTLSDGRLTELNFEVHPYYRVAATVSDSTFTYTLTKSAANDSKLVEVIFMVNDYPIVNENVCSNVAGPGTYYPNLWKLPIGDDVADEAIMDMPQTFTINWAETRLPKGDYYFRVGARAASSPSSTYNYSPVVKATVN
ncbi:DUF3823 domain-containing protein [Parapedobacter koreensis]|uniref:DUF3823 domain-containing protein n=1 Tax=Parapedobacter koreensis TaxID=332977 RepID=A0A1H7K033_9SPHI|nr:DUF3823 domain-containing protein [Parapedobacter koreensis]SEK79954.1 Protein of unknown function [Parapedobacter koreensis]